MRKDNLDRFVEELLDAALTNYRGEEPRAGLEERTLANLREQSRAANSLSRKWASVMVAVFILLMFSVMGYLTSHPVVSDSASVAVSSGDEPRRDESNPAALQAKAQVIEGPGHVAKRLKAAGAAKWARHQDLALDLGARRASERAENDLRVEEVRIAEVKLDDIVISNNERQE
ncbi:MAG: hypothetical protein ACRD9Y_00055 [Blastocatellia bacterium]